MTASPGTAVAFILLVLLMAGITVAALLRADMPATVRTRATLLFVVLYLVGPGALAAAGVLDDYEPVPRPLILILLVTITTFVAARSRVGAALVRSYGFALLVGFQAFRIAVELILHALGQQGAIPEVMTYSGSNFDIVSGLSAAVLGLILLRRDLPRSVILGWNVVGLILLAVIVGIAALSTPIPLQRFSAPDNRLPGVFPYVWLPTVLVQLALMGHLLVFRKLRHDSNSHATR